MGDTDPVRMRRASSDEPHAGHAYLVYNFVVVWVVWNNLCFLVWLFAIAVMSSLWRYLFVGIALMTWPKSWPVGMITVAYDIVSKAMYQHMHSNSVTT